MKNESFEKTLQKLQEVVAKLEDGSMTLDESVTLYEKGVQLNAQCEAALKEAESKIAELKKLLDSSATTA